MAFVNVIWTPDDDGDASAGYAVLLCFEAQGNFNVVWETPKPEHAPPGQLPEPPVAVKTVASIPGGAELEWRGHTGARCLYISRYGLPPAGTELIQVDVVRNHGDATPMFTTTVRPRTVSV